MPSNWTTYATTLVMVLFGLSALAYVRALRRWRGRLTDVAIGESEAARDEFLTSDEYRRLRDSARKPMLACTLLFVVLMVLTRLG